MCDVGSDDDVKLTPSMITLPTGTARMPLGCTQYGGFFSGVDVGRRWDELYETCIPHLDDHLSTFYDMHYLMAFLGAQQKQLVNNFVSSCDAFARYARYINV
jgi:hypothetical protein